MESLQGRLAGHYIIERELGRGGMGLVCQAWDERIGRRVTIKIMLGVTGDAERDRFTREAGTLARLNHPNILSILDVGQVDGRLFYVMPFVDGQSLDALLKQSGKLPVADALTIGIAVAGALEHAHQIGIIHRDVKPSNVLVPSGDYRLAKLTDFGLVGVLDSQTQHTQVGQVFGTPAYMSPEQVQGLPQSSATDVFGLGVLAYQMIYGRTPYSGDSAIQLFNSILHEPAAFPSIPAIADDLRGFLERCLKKIHPDALARR